MVSVIGLVTMASSMPLPQCMNGFCVAVCENDCDCDCEPESPPIPICCLEKGEMSEMLQPQSEQTPKPVAGCGGGAGFSVAGLAGVRSITCTERLDWLNGPPFYLLYQVILR